MASNTPYSLTASDLSSSPEDVIRAVELLQAHGFVVTREPIKRLRATASVDITMAREGDPESIRRSVRRELESVMGAEILTVAQGFKNEDNSRLNFTAMVDVIRPTRGINSISELLR